MSESPVGGDRTSLSQRSMPITAMRPIAVLALAVAAACSSDGPTRPAPERLASQLDALADSSGGFMGPFAFALHSAAAIVEAGGSISRVTIDLDGVPEQFDAVAFRVAYTEAACDQLISGIRDSFGGGIGIGIDTTDIVEEDWQFLCAPSQSLVAWQGDPIRRIALIQGDTGSSAIDNENFSPWTFWASYFDRESRADWWLNEGTKQASLLSDDGPCRQTPQPGPGMQVDCRLATLAHAFDLDMYEFAWTEDVFPVHPGTGVRDSSSIVTDTVIYADTGIVIFPGDSTYPPPEPHTMRMTNRAISGMSLLITSVDMSWMDRRSAHVMMARPGPASR